MSNSGRVMALDRDPARLTLLRAILEVTGATIVTSQEQDFLMLDVESSEFAGVQGVLLDPSCSGVRYILLKNGLFVATCC